MNSEILCVGEVLWDALPAGLFLGGAPFNVACHLNELGLPVTFASRIGNDALGGEITRRLEHRGISTDLLQVDDELPTGFVVVGLDTTGVPDFTIVAPSAWDEIALSPALQERAADARAIVFGSLAQRNATSRETIRQLLKTDALKVFDVNLRKPFDSKDIVEESLKLADIAKLNDDELERLDGWFGLCGGDFTLEAAARSLAERFACPTVCVTRGASGAALWTEGAWYEHAGVRVEVADTVGSGDAFLAAFLERTFSGASSAEVLAYANAVGAYVATQNGATPVHDQETIERLLKA